MKSEEADRVIHEAMGKEWHKVATLYDLDGGPHKWRCITCDATKYYGWDGFTDVACKHNPSYSSPESFLEMLGWASKQEWWTRFLNDGNGYYEQADDDVLMEGVEHISVHLILDPPRMVALVAEWCLKEKGGGE